MAGRIFSGTIAWQPPDVFPAHTVPPRPVYPRDCSRKKKTKKKSALAPLHHDTTAVAAPTLESTAGTDAGVLGAIGNCKRADGTLIKAKRDQEYLRGRGRKDRGRIIIICRNTITSITTLILVPPPHTNPPRPTPTPARIAVRHPARSPSPSPTPSLSLALTPSIHSTIRQFTQNKQLAVLVLVSATPATLRPTIIHPVFRPSYVRRRRRPLPPPRSNSRLFTLPYAYPCGPNEPNPKIKLVLSVGE
ncbi:hypothetical protein D9611_003713 [Ephemerocybe angulata]|uniref:Uncharacterized protein n=1 Tax=Ephemerocybe angulata TaxID=980116 RepID=A0A8H5B6F8_9AGAR|nr:hypothetical protein D9611_003713 [Tulosesus angulatus]